MLQSGIHPTIGGVIFGFATPILGRTYPECPFDYALEEQENLPPDHESEHNEMLQMKLRKLRQLTNLHPLPPRASRTIAPFLGGIFDHAALRDYKCRCHL